MPVSINQNTSEVIMSVITITSSGANACHQSYNPFIIVHGPTFDQESLGERETTS